MPNPTPTPKTAATPAAVAAAASIPTLDPGTVTPARITEIYEAGADFRRQLAEAEHARIAKNPPAISGTFEKVAEYSADTFPDRLIPAILAVHTPPAVIEADAASLPDRISAVVNRASEVRAQIGENRGALLSAHEAAQAALLAAQERARIAEDALRVLDHRTAQNKSRCDRLDSIGRDLGEVYRKALTYLRIDAEMEHRENALIDELAAIPEHQRLPEDEDRHLEYLALTPAQQLYRKIKMIGRTLKAAALGIDQVDGLSLDYRVMVCNAFGVHYTATLGGVPGGAPVAPSAAQFLSAPRRWQIFGAISAEIGRDGIATGRFSRAPGDIDRLETALAQEIGSLYRAFPAADPNPPAEESLTKYRITAGGDTNGRRRGQTIELLPSDAARINTEYGQLHKEEPPRLTLESSLPAAPPIPIPAKQARS